MVKVYLARVTDAERAETTKTQHKGTLEWISMLPGGKPIFETEEDVSEDDIDGQGRYVPEKRLDAKRP